METKTEVLTTLNFLTPEYIKYLTQKHVFRREHAQAFPTWPQYYKLFGICVLANFAAIFFLLFEIGNQNRDIHSDIATAITTNFTISIIIRNEHIINLCFRIFCSLPLSTPLYIRRRAAKVYALGGIHSGCAISGAAWYAISILLLFLKPQGSGILALGLVFTAGITIILLVILLLFSHPYVRSRSHNEFEMTHRFIGWGLMLLLWLQVVISALTRSTGSGLSLGHHLVRQPPVWLLLVSTLFIAYPWIRLRKYIVAAEKLSDHAVRLNFHGAIEEPCMTRAIGTFPIVETHRFATIPNETGFSVIVSNAGDWTRHLIKATPPNLWIKGQPTFGVTKTSCLFRKVLFVATGSAIGPVLSAFKLLPVDRRAMLWITRDPVTTYGRPLLDELEAAGESVMILNTTDVGAREKYLVLSYAIYHETKAEAVYIISNRKVTEDVVGSLEAKGIPAFGPIFDS